jgi:CelD/BcsL family acetyltransferase involved in cellulose biosynthesis
MSDLIKFRLLALDDVDWDQADQYSDRVVFQTREWLEYLAETQDGTPAVAEISTAGAVVGIFSGVIIKRFGVRILGSSFPGWTTPYIGFNLASGVERRHLLAPLRRWAFKELGCLHLEVSDRAFLPGDGVSQGFENRPYESYQTDLTRSEEELFAAMEGACRRCIRKAARSGVVIEEATDLQFADEYYAQLVEVFAKQGLTPTYSQQRVRALVRHVGPTGRLLMLRALSPDGNCIATGLYAGMNDTAFFWGNASWRAGQQWRPNEALHWHAMRYWKARGVAIFDWGGGGTYKEKYGVQPRRVPWFISSRYPAVTAARNWAQRQYYRGHALLGKLRTRGSSNGR